VADIGTHTRLGAAALTLPAPGSPARALSFQGAVVERSALEWAMGLPRGSCVQGAALSYSAGPAAGGGEGGLMAGVPLLGLWAQAVRDMAVRVDACGWV